MHRLHGENSETLIPAGLGVAPHHQELQRAQENQALGHTEANENSPGEKKKQLR